MQKCAQQKNKKRSATVLISKINDGAVFFFLIRDDTPGIGIEDQNHVPDGGIACAIAAKLYVLLAFQPPNRFALILVHFQYGRIYRHFLFITGCLYCGSKRDELQGIKKSFFIPDKTLVPLKTGIEFIFLPTMRIPGFEIKMIQAVAIAEVTLRGGAAGNN